MDEEEVNKDARYTYMDTTPSYSSSVLTGQWCNIRNESLPQSKTAIVPAVLLQDVESDKTCERHTTTNQEDYNMKDFEPISSTRDFIGDRVNNYCNLITQHSSDKFQDAEKYNNNFTSLNMLVYNLWPKTLKEQLAVASLNATDSSVCQKIIANWKPDRLDAYGNHTCIKRTICKEPVCPTPTVYRRDFIARYPSIPPRPRIKDTLDRLT